MDEDDDLQAIRAKRMAEMQRQFGVARGGASDMQGKGEAGEEEGAAADGEAARRSREAEMRNAFLSQVLNQEARARLNTIAAAKPDKAKMVENMLMNMFRMGQIQGKLDEEELKSLLERVREKTAKTTTVKFDRRRNVMDDDES